MTLRDNKFPRHEHSKIGGHVFLLRPYWWVAVGGEIFPFIATFGRMGVQWEGSKTRKREAS